MHKLDISVCSKSKCTVKRTQVKLRASVMEF